MSIDVGKHDRTREWSRMQEQMPEFGTYLFGMPDARHIRFGTVVRRALESAINRGISIKQIEDLTKVSKSTFYRWRDGDWIREPARAHVVSFCDALGVPRGHAFAALGWDEQRQATPPPAMDPNFEVLLRRLEDPTVSDREKFHIQETIQALVNRVPKRRPNSGRVDRAG